MSAGRGEPDDFDPLLIFTHRVCCAAQCGNNSDRGGALVTIEGGVGVGTAGEITTVAIGNQ